MVWGRRKQSKNLRDYEPEWVYRPELQIVPLELWEEAQQVREKRRVNRANPGARGQYPFTGLVICENCGGSMIGGLLTHPKPKRAIYRCNNGHNYGQTRCPQPKTYSHKLITQAMIPFLTALITQQLGLDEVLTEAASAYGTTQTEEGLKEAIQAELYRIRDEKNRLVKSVAAGILTDEETREYLSELRDTEARQQRELKIMNQKDRIRKDYLQAIEALMDHDIKEMLTKMSEKKRASFRRLLFLIFKPNRLQVRITGSGKRRKASIVGYEFTEEFASLLPDKAVNQDTRRDSGQPVQIVDF